MVEWLANRFTVQVYEVRSPASENMFFLFNSDIVNLFLNNNSGGGGGGGEIEGLILLFCSLAYFNFWWMGVGGGVGGMEQKILFRTS